MALRLRTLLVVMPVLVNMGHLCGQKSNAIMISIANGFTIMVAMVKTGDFARKATFKTTQEMVDVRK